MNRRFGWSAAGLLSRGPVMLSGSDTVVIRRGGDGGRAIPFCAAVCPALFRSRSLVDPRAVPDDSIGCPRLIPTTHMLSTGRKKPDRVEKIPSRPGLPVAADRQVASTSSRAWESLQTSAVARHRLATRAYGRTVGRRWCRRRSTISISSRPTGPDCGPTSPTPSHGCRSATAPS